MHEAQLERPTRAPVVLVHGLVGGSVGLAFLRRCLRDQGFPVVEVFRYRPLGGIAHLADQLGRYVDDLVSTSDGGGLHLVGHSLGGLVARFYTQLAGGASKVLACVTLGTPSSGVPLARLGIGRLARELRPRSELLRRLDEAPAGTNSRITSFFGRRDLLVMRNDLYPRNGHANGAKSIVVNGLGHIGLLFSSKMASAVAAELLAAEGARASTQRIV